MIEELQLAVPVLAAAIGGAAVGVERQWSGHASGPAAHFAGVRTFTLLGAVAGIAGWLARRGHAVPAAVLLGAAAALVVAAYVAASRHDVDGTTEVAALVVLGAGTVAGTGALTLASAIIAITCLLLVEKSRLHSLIARLDDVELRAGVRFAVMAVVILPLLPEGPFGPWGGIRPRQLWVLVLLFAGLSFAGFVARRLVGPEHGYRLAGLLGGLVSSTSVTLTFARASHRDDAPGQALAAGVLAACTVMFGRMLIASAILNPSLAAAALPYLAVPLLAGIGLSLSIRAGRPIAGEPRGPANPLEFWAALQMVAVFQVVLFVIHGVRAVWGDAGLLGTGAMLGLTDVDALTLAMSATAAQGTPVAVAARALAAGALTNTLLKLGIAAAAGRGRFRIHAAGSLAVLALAGALVLWLR
jgi:uncharacterized membrane protein (DUF4010 family)